MDLLKDIRPPICPSQKRQQMALYTPRRSFHLLRALREETPELQPHIRQEVRATGISRLKQKAFFSFDYRPFFMQCKTRGTLTLLKNINSIYLYSAYHISPETSINAVIYFSFLPPLYVSVDTFLLTVL